LLVLLLLLWRRRRRRECLSMDINLEMFVGRKALILDGLSLALV
jgi:hypothetical protein